MQKGLISLGINEEHQFVALAKMLGKEVWLVDKKFSNKNNRKKTKHYLLNNLRTF